MSGILRHLTRRKFDDGGRIRLNDPYITGMSDPRTQIPTTASSSMPGASGREYHPLADADYYTYGQKGPEHQFFTGSLPVAPLKPNNLPSGGGGGGSSGSGGAAGVLNDLTQLAGAAKTTGELLNMAGVDNSYTQAMQDPIGSIKNTWGNSQLNNVGSGQYANTALEDAGFGSNWTTPALSGLGAAGAASTGVGGGAGTIASITPEMIPEAIAATTGGGAAGGAGAAGAEGLGAGASGSGGSAAAGGFGAAAAPAIVAAAIIFGGMNMSDAIKEFGSDAVEKAGFLGMAKLPDISGASKGKVSDEIFGKLQAADQGLRDLGVRELISYRDTDNPLDLSGYGSGPRAPQKRNMQMARGGDLSTGSPGILAYANDPKFVGKVRGEGTGRSDEIPARLSDGEYVMDAETVAMLGDGSTEAGARKLDQLRANLRKHKGKNLARGKFSDNAKDPEEYLQGDFSLATRQAASREAKRSKK